MPEGIGWVEVGMRGRVVVASVHGEVDVSNVDDIRRALEMATEGRKGRYYVDLSETTYLDSSGIRVLFNLASRLQSRRQQLLVIVPEHGLTRRVLELTDVQKLIPMLSSPPEIDAG